LWEASPSFRNGSAFLALLTALGVAFFGVFVLTSDNVEDRLLALALSVSLLLLTVFLVKLLRAGVAHLTDLAIERMIQRGIVSPPQGAATEPRRAVEPPRMS
jgi:predicted membrane channel-forming protein YqfA (hemolysin III family)